MSGTRPARNTTFDFLRQMVLLTGAGRRIGFAVARPFVEAGATVYAAHRDRDAVRVAAAEAGARPLHVDVHSSKDAAVAVSRAVTETG